MSGRYAVFFCPDDSTALAAFGQRVLGRCANGTRVKPSTDDYPDKRLASLRRATPALYGFHATLKAPFYLAEDVSEAALLAAVEELATQQTTIHMDTLHPKLLSDFVALVFDGQPEKVASLAAQCVRDLESFRAPLTAADIAKRCPDQLTSKQRKNLDQYGYPYVLNEFRFHMTLSGSINLPIDQPYFDWLNELYQKRVPEPPVLDRLAVFWQSDRQTPFRRIAQFAFNEMTIP